MTGAALPRAGTRSRTGGALAGALRLVLATVLTLGPVGSVIVLGWLQRRMAATVACDWGQGVPAPGLVLGAPSTGRLARALGGLAANLASGAGALALLAALTLPFTLPMAGAWWAGWVNSFTKGYEDAAVGPATFLAAWALAVPVLVLLPLALAHAAVEGRWTAGLQVPRVWSAARAAGWRLPALHIATAILALPFLLLQALPVFLHHIVPGYPDVPPEVISDLRQTLSLAGAGWSVVALVLLRGVAARIYAVAAPRAAARDPARWQGTRAATVPAPARPSRLWPLWLGLSGAAALALPVQVLVAQFLNHGWWAWITHPLWGLPWMP
jgi:hypothetical protein